MVVAVVALLVGLGLGNVWGSSARDRADLAGQLDDRVVELEVAEARIADLEARADRFQSLLTEAARVRAAAEEALGGFARAAAADRDPGGAVDAAAADTSAALGAWVRVVRSGERAALTRSYAPGALVSFEQHGVVLAGATGARQAGDVVRELVPADLRLAGPTRAYGGFAAVGYVHAAGTGIVAVRVVDGLIVRQWFFLDGSF